MHALPLPFGLALVLIPRRELDRLRRREIVLQAIGAAAPTRWDHVPDDIRFYRV
jgi:hypothetical protein